MSSKSNPSHTPQAGTLASHRVLTFAGADAASFLQGYLTCDTAQLSTSEATPGAFTNLKGRVVANGWVWGDTIRVQMLVPSSLTQAVSDFLKPYMNFSRTKLSIAEQPPFVALPAGEVPAGEVTAGEVAIGTDRRVIQATQTGPDLSTEWLAACIAHNEAVVTAAVSGTYLPQMLGLTELGAVSFDKGCYLGQEVVARAEHRGAVKRRLRRARYKAASPLLPGGVLTDVAGKRLGNVVCATEDAVLLVSAVDELGTETWLVDELEVTLQFT